MRLILAAEQERLWKWFFVTAPVALVIAASGVNLESNDTTLPVRFCVIAALAISWGMFRDHPHYRMLPVSDREVGRAMWRVTVVLPTLLTGTVALVGVLAATLSGVAFNWLVSIPNLYLAGLAASAMLSGSIILLDLLLERMPTNLEPRTRELRRIVLAYLIWRGILFLQLRESEAPVLLLAMLCFVAGAGVAISYVYFPRFLRIGDRCFVAGSRQSPESKRSQVRLGVRRVSWVDWPWFRLWVTAAKDGMLSSALVLFILWFLYHLSSSNSLKEFVDRYPAPMWGSFVALSNCAAPWISRSRLLRILPLSRSALTVALVALPVIFLVAGSAASLLLGIVSGHTEVGNLFAVTLLLWLGPGVMAWWFGGNLKGLEAFGAQLLSLMGGVFLLYPESPVLQALKPTWGVQQSQVLFAAILLLLSWVLVRATLGRWGGTIFSTVLNRRGTGPSTGEPVIDGGKVIVPGKPGNEEKSSFGARDGVQPRG